MNELNFTCSALNSYKDLKRCKQHLQERKNRNITLLVNFRR